MTVEMTIRTAQRADREALHALQALSLRMFAVPYYGSEVIEAFIARGIMFDRLLDEGTYFVVHHGTTLIGCGGWSSHIPQGPAFTTAPEQERATIRSVFVHPNWTRRGVARQIMETIEAEMAEAGHDQAWLLATLSGVPFYRRLGWQSDHAVTLELTDELKLMAINMYKRLK